MDYLVFVLEVYGIVSDLFMKQTHEGVSWD